MREITMAGTMDCRKCLEKTDYDVDKAILYLKTEYRSHMEVRHGIKWFKTRIGRNCDTGTLSITVLEELEEENCKMSDICKDREALRPKYEQFIQTEKGKEWKHFWQSQTGSERSGDFGDYLYDFYPEILPV